jgi:phosphatidylserine decarboxylase
VNLTALAERLTVDSFRRAPTGLYSAVVGACARAPVPRPLRAALDGAFARAVDARVDEAANELSEYPSFGDFFARRLREGARPVDETSAVVAPCDGVVAASGPIVDGTLVQAKGKTYSVAELVTLPSLAAALAGGQFVTTYLSPRDYHRVHTPVDGTLVGYHYVPGQRWPVSARFMRHVDRLLAINERVVIELSTAWGPAAVVMVAASGVGNMWLSHLENDTRVWHASGEPRHVTMTPAALAAGDELGSFLLGSTVVMLLPAAAPRLREMVDGDVVRFGEGLSG